MVDNKIIVLSTKMADEYHEHRPQVKFGIKMSFKHELK
jgi:hypothetical protein